MSRMDPVQENHPKWSRIVQIIRRPSSAYSARFPARSWASRWRSSNCGGSFRFFRASCSRWMPRASGQIHAAAANTSRATVMIFYHNPAISYTGLWEFFVICPAGIRAAQKHTCLFVKYILQSLPQPTTELFPGGPPAWREPCGRLQTTKMRGRSGRFAPYRARHNKKSRRTEQALRSTARRADKKFFFCFFSLFTKKRRSPVKNLTPSSP